MGYPGTGKAGHPGAVTVPVNAERYRDALDALTVAATG